MLEKNMLEKNSFVRHVCVRLCVWFIGYYVLLSLEPSFVYCVLVLKLGFCQPHFGLSPGSVRQREGGVRGWLQRLRRKKEHGSSCWLLLPRGPLEQNFSAPTAAVSSYSSGSIHFPVASILAGPASLHPEGVGINRGPSHGASSLCSPARGDLLPLEYHRVLSLSLSLCFWLCSD